MFWQAVWYAFLTLGCAVAAIIAVSIVHRPTLRRLRRGGNLSKLATRLLGSRHRFVWSKNLLWLCWLCSSLLNQHLYLVLGNVYLGLIVDDFLTGDDDEPRKKRHKARVRLKMPRPVFLRPVERY